MGDMKTALLFGAAPVAKDFRPVLPKHDLVLCADGGYSLARRWAVQPDLVLGDFDSLIDVPNDVPTRVFPAEKDDTDMMLCAKVALSEGCERLFLFGVLGARLDHTLANLQLLSFLCDHGAKGVLWGDNEIVTIQRGGQNDSVDYPAQKEYPIFSLFSLSETCEGVTLDRVKYPLRDGVFTRRFPLGVSNEITASNARVCVASGDLLVVYSRGDTETVQETGSEKS